jgi:hypothetical protein
MSGFEFRVGGKCVSERDLFKGPEMQIKRRRNCVKLQSLSYPHTGEQLKIREARKPGHSI